MKFASKRRNSVLMPLLAAAGIGAVGSLAALYSGGAISDAAAQSTKEKNRETAAVKGAAAPAINISINSQLLADLPPNPNITNVAMFAWQEFIALNWPAAKQTGVVGSNTRGVPDNSKKFGEDSSGPDQANQPVVWETYRSKVETFPGVGNPPGYVNNKSQDYGFDVGPQYNYKNSSTTPPKALDVPACKNQPSVANPAYVNLDEISQIGVDQMFAGVLNPTPVNPNLQPQLIRFLAKGNRTFYDYVAGNQYWYPSAAYNKAQFNFSNAAANNKYPPPSPTITLNMGTVLVKAAWRPLAQSEMASDFHTKTVRFYDNAGNGTACYREQTWALIALHIIQKTPKAPSFVFATFEYTSNILTADGKPVEDVNGAEVNAPAGDAMDPQLNYFDVNSKYYSPDYPKGITVPPQPPVPNPPPSPVPAGVALPVVQTNPNAKYCDTAGNSRLYFQDAKQTTGSFPPVCVNKRYFAIPLQIQQVNAAAHSALSQYGAPALWQNYKLVNVQWQPFDISDIDTSAKNTSRLASTFSLSNSVVETDNTLQQFFGGLFDGPSANNGFVKSAFEKGIISNGTAYNNYGPPSGSVPKNQFTRLNMGGCMGCHGRAQASGTDFSFTLAGGPVEMPEFATAPTDPAASAAGGASNFRVGFDEKRLKALHDALGGH